MLETMLMLAALVAYDPAIGAEPRGHSISNF